LIEKNTKHTTTETQDTSLPDYTTTPDYKTIVENFPHGVMIVNEFNDIQYINSTTLCYLQKSPNEIVGKNIGFGPVSGETKSIIFPMDIDPIRQHFEACFRTIYWNGNSGHLITLQPQNQNIYHSLPNRHINISNHSIQIHETQSLIVRFTSLGTIQEAVDVSPGYFLVDPDYGTVYTVFDLLPEIIGDFLSDHLKRISHTNPSSHFIGNIINKSGHNQNIHFEVKADFDKTSTPIQYTLTGNILDSSLPFANNITALSSVIDNASEGIAFINASGTYIHSNKQFYKTLGYNEKDILGKPIDFILSGIHSSNFFNAVHAELSLNGCWEGECWLQHKDQHIFPANIQAVSILNEQDEVCCYALYFSDRSELKLVENNLRHIALHDTLTDLPNRTMLQEKLYQSIRLAKKSTTQFAILHLDLDGFKFVNNTFGHTAGDILLREVANRILLCTHKDDLLARMGGDEFAMISLHAGNEGLVPASVTAQKILDTLSRPYLINQQEVFISASIGISLYPDDGDNALALLKNADIAMYRAKELGKSNFQFYSEELNRRVLKRLDMEKHLRHALERDEFHLLYQPIVDSRTRKIVAIEALLRWDHTSLGRIMPDDFIPLAEETGLIVEIGYWVLHTACRQQITLEQSGYPSIFISINISGRQLEDDHFGDNVKAAIEETGIDPSKLVLEITESLLMQHIDENVKKLNDLRKLGVKISIDDFGTGYSSLNSLVNLPIDSLKIDKSFVAALEENPHGLSLVKGVISIGHNLDMEVIAEGVENTNQAAVLEKHNCNLLQGYYFGMPMNFVALCKAMDSLL
jgi:diguanylate cyclase (GGDEF)-like protein/PAS domain S-box-containing protein